MSSISGGWAMQISSQKHNFKTPLNWVKLDHILWRKLTTANQQPSNELIWTRAISSFREGRRPTKVLTWIYGVS